MLRNVAAVVLDGVEPFELGVVCEVFGTDRSDDGLPVYDFAVVAGEPGPLRTSQGFTLSTPHGLDRLAAADLIAIPAVNEPRVARLSELPAPLLAELRRGVDRGARVLSVCNGAFVLGAAGLLDGRRCTTHHDLQDDLARRYPRACVRDVLYVLDGRVVTSAGIASGIDLALHLVATAHGPGAAARVAREMVVYARRNGSEPQASAMLRHRAHLSDTVHRAQDLIDARFTERLPLAALAASSGVSQRTLTRLFGQATGMTPLRYRQLLRAEHAEHLIGHGATVASAARAAGFEDPRMLRRLRTGSATRTGSAIRTGIRAAGRAGSATATG
jgi:transcriptional regulator GlxA family with amidase domain